jgi:hypothetical protein
MVTGTGRLDAMVLLRGSGTVKASRLRVCTNAAPTLLTLQAAVEWAGVSGSRVPCHANALPTPVPSERALTTHRNNSDVPAAKAVVAQT